MRKATLKTADKRYSSTNNDYEMTFNSETEISPCEDDGEIALPTMTFNFIPINQLESTQPNSIIGKQLTFMSASYITSTDV